MNNAQLAQSCLSLAIPIASAWSQLCTHLVMGELLCTEKLLLALTSGTRRSPSASLHLNCVVGVVQVAQSYLRRGCTNCFTARTNGISECRLSMSMLLCIDLDTFAACCMNLFSSEHWLFVVSCRCMFDAMSLFRHTANTRVSLFSCII